MILVRRSKVLPAGKQMASRMRLSTITHLPYAITLVLTTVSAATFILSARSASQERMAIQQHLDVDDLAEELAVLAESRTDEARLYVMRGDEQHLAKFYVDDDQEGHLEGTIANYPASVSRRKRTRYSIKSGALQMISTRSRRKP